MRNHDDIRKLYEKATFQMNDTHPTVAVAELMRILLDVEGYSWDEAWNIVTHTVAYTNHTVLAEALERWPQNLFEHFLPRIWQITQEIASRWQKKVEDFYHDPQKTEKMAIVWGGQVRMANLCIAGGIAKQILSRRGVYVGAHLQSVGTVADALFPLQPTKELFDAVAAKPFPVLDDQAGERMQALILEARKNLDSVGGVVECAATGLPAGLGEPMFGGVENRLAAALFGIPAVKGVEFGAGFAAARSCGSANNDPFIISDGRVVTTTNHAGGILGGISTGAPVMWRMAVKPTPSIGREQQTVDMDAIENAELSVHGRHDPCIVPRAVPVAEAAAALAIWDALLEDAGQL